MKKSIALLLATVLLLASVISIFAVQAEESAKSVAPDELIATVDVNTGALYATGSNTVLAAIGENMTIERITAYLLGLEAGKDYNYFYVYA
ncbi:MAG: hypothetical protein J1E00_06830, partial [Oscillospiraceae bacterium]|nr:hypothetical protein [Oscillospiraceae bacterium]